MAGRRRCNWPDGRRGKWLDRWLGERGVKELFLVSENSTSYGKDLGDIGLLEKILPDLAAVPGIERVRVSYLQPAEIRPGLLDAMASVPDLACMVGLYAYNAPQCMEAAKEAGKIGSMKIVSFDEQDAVLQGIVDGTVAGTISQQPYYYGFESVRILNGLANGDKSVLPPGGFLEVPIVEVTKANVEAFRVELKKMQADGK